MSVENKDPFGEAHDPNVQAMRPIMELASKLEHIAQNYSEDYREGYVDGCYASAGDSCLGNELETDISFQAERVRDEHRPAIYGEIIAATYTVMSTFKRRFVEYEEVPDALVDFLVEADDYDLEELEAPGVEFAFGYEQTFTIGSDGQFEHDYGLYFYVDGNSVELTDSILDAINEAEQDEAGPDGAPTPQVEDDLFLQIFSEEERLAIEGVARVVLEEHESPQTALARLQKLIEPIKDASKEDRYIMAARIVDQLFMRAEA